MSLPPDELTIGAHGAQVRHASEWLEAACLRRGVPPALAERLELCLNEVLANVIDHGGDTARSEPIRLRFQVRADQDRFQASVSVSDSGVAFNPLTVPERAQPRTLDEATTSGMGLEIIRRCAGSLDYRREAGRNHLTFGASWNSR